MVGFEKALGTVKVIKDQIQYRSQSLLNLARDYFSCNGRKHSCKYVSDPVPSSFDTREHIDCNIASLTGIVINFSVSSSCNDRSYH